jgi:hypothetical protein
MTQSETIYQEGKIHGERNIFAKFEFQHDQTANSGSDGRVWHS